MRLRLHSFLPRSRANGPGLRAVIWVQGCSLGCPGCFNPETHALAGGETVDVAELCERIGMLEGKIEGITVSGGEPLQQLGATTELLRRVRNETSLSTLLFTGFGWKETQKLPRAGELLDGLDVVLAGRYHAHQRVARGLLGSANKTIHFLTDRYSARDLETVPEAEIVIGPDGSAVFSGINPVVIHA